MATQNPSLPAFFNTDTDFRDWVSGIHTMFTNIGLVQTSDTGQINTGTVAKPAAANTFQGYSIWRFDDSLQSTKPVFIRFDFGSGSGAADRPALKVKVGSTTDGAGTLGGQLGTQITAQAAASKTAGVTLPSWISGDSGGVRGFINYDGTSNTFGIGLFVERARNSDGTYNNTGVNTLVLSDTTHSQEQFIPSSGSVPAAITPGSSFMRNVATPSTQNGNSSSGGDVALWPFLVFCNGKVGFCSLFAFSTSDIASDVTSFAVTVFGGSHTMLPFKKHTSSPGGNSAYDIATLWE